MSFFDRLFGGNSYKYQNTREYLRLPAAWPIKCEPKTKTNGRHVTATKDVSAGGLSVVMQEMIPVGSRIHVEIHVPPLNRSIQAEAQVVRCLPSRTAGFELGIQFLEINPEEREALKKAIDKFAGPHLRARQHRSWWRTI